ncbi:MAG: hypothetical protein PWQ97_219 [Tepidanaerobacteraceae bacterium]|nr:hypothetical protein [Tepidanaerobacteraceae bacterium]
MKTLQRALAGLLVIAAFLSTYLLSIKISAEARAKTVEISVPAREVSMLATAVHKNPVDVLKELKESGLTSLAVEETTVKDLQNSGRILILSGWQVLDHERFLGVDSQFLQGWLSRKDFNPKSYYVFTKDVDIFNKLFSFMRARGYEIKSYTDRNLYIIQEVKGTGGFSSIGMGFDQKLLDMAEAMGLSTIVMVKGLKQKTPIEMNSLKTQLASRNISILISQGNEAPSNTESARILRNYMASYGIKLGFDEFYESEQLKEAIEKLDYSAVRVYNRPPHKWMDEYLLAVRDRNDRLLYLHLFLSGHKDILAYDKEHIAQIRDMIVSNGFKLAVYPDRAAGFTPFAANKLFSILSALGILWVLEKIMKMAELNQAFSLKMILIFSALLIGLAIWDFTLFRDIAGLLAAVSFPVLGIYAEMKRENPPADKGFCRAWCIAIYGFLRASALTLIGAAVLWGIYGGIGSLLGLEKFRGIKALYILSYGIIFILYLRENYSGLSLKKPILSIWNMIFMAIFGIMLFVLINRTGNFSVIPIPKWELSFRIWLENTLWVRPRTKEFLLGFPALIVAGGLGAMGYNKWAGWLYMVALVGEVSMMNTFSHFHVAALVSVIRSLEGMVLGAILGSAVLGGFYLYEKRRKGYHA